LEKNKEGWKASLTYHCFENDLAFDRFFEEIRYWLKKTPFIWKFIR